MKDKKTLDVLLEMKTVICEMKNILDGINDKVGMQKERWMDLKI